MQSHDLRDRPCICPQCGATLDGAADSEPDPRPPQAGDLSLCAYCHAELTYTEQGTLEPLTKADRAQLTEEERAGLERARAVLQRGPKIPFQEDRSKPN